MARTVPPGSPITGVAQEVGGVPLAGVDVTVLDLEDNAVTVYSDAAFTTELDPPTTDGEGKFSFYAPEGTYKISVDGGQGIENVTVPADADAPAGAVDAADVTYDNSDSDLTATDAKGALDELAGRVAALEV